MVYTPLGNYDFKKAGHPESYYSERHCMIDYRGDLRVSPLSYFGFGVTIITQTHVIDKGEFTPYTKNKTVIIDDYAWITSKSILYDCHVMHHGIVSLGAVVDGITVEPFTIVAGNPARPVARWNGTKWERL